MDVAVRRQVRIMKVYTVALTIGVMLLAASFSQSAKAGTNGKVKFDDIQAQRITIVEKDGTRRLVLANSDLSPAPFMDGKPLPGAHDGGRPGMIFYNDEGDEDGGLSFGGAKGQSRYGALTFDQFKQDQTIQLAYDEGADGKRQSALLVMDRPDAPLSQMAEELEKIMAMPDGPEKTRALEAFHKKYPSPTRLFAGKAADRSSQIRLSDAAGRPRIVLRVDASGTPQIQFLDANGNVTRSISS